MTLKNHIKYLIFFLLLIIVIYYPSFDCGFFSDDFIGLDRYQNQGFSGFKNNFNDRFFLPIGYFFQVTELLVFGKTYFLYHLTNIILFALSANFLRICVEESGFYNNPKDKHRISFLTALIFIVIPYQTETVNWYSSQAYLISVLFTLLSAYYLIKYTQQSPRSLSIHFLFLFLAVSTKEIALTTPLIFFIYLYNLKKYKSIFLLKYLLYCCILLSIYFSWRFISLGEIIGGYGQNVHLNFDFKLLSFNLAAYLSKFFLFHRYTDESVRLFVSFSTILIFVFFSLRWIIKKNPFYKKIPFLNLLPLFYCFILSVLPVLNLETSFLHSIQSDRYGYFPSIFFSIIVATLVQKIKVNWFRNIITFGFLSLNILLCIKDNFHWRDAGNYRDKFLKGLSSINDQNTVIMNIADNYNGIYVFRNGLDRCLTMNKIKCSPKIILSQEVLPNQKYQLFRTNRKIVFVTKPGVIYSVFNNSKPFPFTVELYKGNVALITLQSRRIDKLTYFNGNKFVYL